MTYNSHDDLKNQLMKGFNLLVKRTNESVVLSPTDQTKCMETVIDWLFPKGRVKKNVENSTFGWVGGSGVRQNP